MYIFSSQDPYRRGRETGLGVFKHRMNQPACENNKSSSAQNIS